MAKTTSTTTTYRLANGEVVSVTGNTEIIGQQLWAAFAVAGQSTTTLADGSAITVSSVDGSVTDVAGNGAQIISDYNSTSDTIWGNNGGDTIGDYRSGGTGGDSFMGGTAKDTLQDLGTAAVGTYRDVFFGANGADALAGGHGADTLIGGLGNDTMTAGAGATTFNYYTNTGTQVSDSPYATGGAAVTGANVAWDIINGFRHGTDRLDFGASTVIGPVNVGSGVSNLVTALSGPGWKGSLVWVGAGGSDADAGVANPLHAHAVWQDASYTFVYADINGDGRADLKIQVNGAHLGAGDFNGAVADPGPVISGPATFAVDEDTTSGVLGIAVASPNAGDSVTGPVTITGVPSDATLGSAAHGDGVTHKQDGSWTVTLAALADLNLSAGEDTTATLTVSTTDFYGFSSTKTIALTVNPVPEAPTVTLPYTTLALNEDASASMLISMATQDSDDVLDHVTITGAPADATFSSAAHTAAVTHNSDGSWTIGTSAFADILFSAGEDGTATLHVTGSTSGPEGATSADQTIAVTINAVPEAPTVSLAHTTVSVDEDASVALGLAMTAHDQDDTLGHLTVTGVPADATLGSLAHPADVVQNSDGSWTIQPDAVADLTLTAGEDSTATLHVTGTTSGTEGATSADQTIALTINAVPEAPAVTLGHTTLAVDEGAGAALGITMTAQDGDDALDHLTITGVPADATLSSTAHPAGVTHNSDGSWTIAPDALADLTLTAGEDGTATLHVTGTTSGTEGATSADQTIALTINAVPEAPTVSLAQASLSVDENASTLLGITMTPHDSDDVDQVTITGVPSDATLGSSSDAAGVVHNADGSWTIASGALGDLTLTGGESGAATLHVTGSNTGGEAASSADQTIALTVNAVAEAPTVNLAHTTLALDEGASVAVGVSMTAHDGDDTLDHVTITGVPTDATLSSATHAAGVTHSADGSWTVAAAALADLALNAGEDGTATLHVTGTTSGVEGATSTEQTIALTVNAVAEAPVVKLASTSITETAGTAVALGISMTSRDADDTLGHVTVTGAPTDATLSSTSHPTGVTQNTDSSWTIAPDALGDLMLNAGSAETATLHVTGTSSGDEGATSADQTIALTVNPADAEGAVAIGFTMDIANLSNLTTAGTLAQSQSMGSLAASGDADDTFTYALGSGTDAAGHTFDTTHFSLSSTGTLATGAAAVQAATYYLDVVATDSDAAPNAASQEIIVWVDGNTGDTANFSTSTLPVLAYAMGGSDTVSGSSAGSSLFGGIGNDVLVGGSGNDVLVGGAGGDQLTGDGGANKFVYLAAGDSTPGTSGTKANYDTITDFVASGTTHDTIDTSQIAGITTIQGSTTTTVNAHSVAWVISGGNAVVYANTSASAETIGATHGAPDMEIRLTGVTALDASDFAHA